MGVRHHSSLAPLLLLIYSSMGFHSSALNDPWEAHFRGMKACGVRWDMQPLAWQPPRARGIFRAVEEPASLGSEGFCKLRTQLPSCLQTSPGAAAELLPSPPHRGAWLPRSEGARLQEAPLTVLPTGSWVPRSKALHTRAGGLAAPASSRASWTSSGLQTRAALAEGASPLPVPTATRGDVEKLVSAAEGTNTVGVSPLTANVQRLPFGPSSPLGWSGSVGAGSVQIWWVLPCTQQDTAG